MGRGTLSPMNVPSSPRRHLVPRFAVRATDLGKRCDTFLVVAVSSVLANRIFLIVTGYPQLGDGTLHISHAIWGALMMATGIIMAISFLGPFTRSIVAVLGGAGFGWFIDELGKFITRKVNYFFQPTIALIYMTFIAMYLVFRAIQRRRYTPEEALLNALEALKAAGLGQLDEPSRRQAIELLDRTEPEGALAREVRGLLVNVHALPPRTPGRWARMNEAMRRRYISLTGHPRFPTVVDLVFISVAAIAVVDVIALGVDGPGIVTFAERATFVSSLVAAGLVVIGAFELHRSRPNAYRWFDRGLLVQIFVVQVFVFAEEQLAGVIGLALALVSWTLLRTAMHAEQERATLEGSIDGDGPDGAAVESRA